MPPSRAIALDVGGSSIKSGIVVFDIHAVNGFRMDAIDSYSGGEAILEVMAGVINAHIAQVVKAELSGIGIGFPGPFDYAQGICLMQGISSKDEPGSRGKYDAIFGIDLRAALRDRLEQPDLVISFRNDAEAAIMGEAKYGAGRGRHRLIGVTLGTGLGSAFISAGVRQTTGMGVPPGGWLFMQPVAGRQADDVFSTRGMLSRMAKGGVDVKDVAQAAKAARRGNEDAQRAFHAFGSELGGFLSPFAAAFAAESVLVLGGIAQAFDLFGQALIHALPVPVITGALGAHAALLGAVDGLEPLRQ